MTEKKQPPPNKPPKPHEGKFPKQPLRPLRDSRRMPPSIRDTHPKPDNKPVKK